MIQVQNINPYQLPAILRSSEISILKIGYGGTAGFYEDVQRYFSAEYGTRTALAFIEMSKIDFTDFFMQLFVHKCQSKLGWTLGDYVNPGYYLFFNENLEAYHSGNIDWEDDKSRIMAGGAIAIAAIFLKSKDGVRLGSKVLESKAAGRVIDFFQVRLQSLLTSKLIADGIRIEIERQQERERAQAEVGTQELTIAYRILGVSPTATDNEIKRKYHEAALLWHPDKCHGDPEKSKISEQVMGRINQANETILRFRRCGKI